MDIAFEGEMIAFDAVNRAAMTVESGMSRAEGVVIPAGKPLALLVYLSCSEKEVSRDVLAELLWPNSTRSRARHSVWQALWYVRDRLGADAILGDEKVHANSERVLNRKLEGRLW